MPAGASPEPEEEPGAVRLSARSELSDLDWAQLRKAADEVAARAYAPYSDLRVGAAGVCEDGLVVAGCNVENASYGLTLCAECGLVSALIASGRRNLVAVSVTAGDGRPVVPCGRCRQLLMEHGGAELLLDGGPGRPPRRLGDLIPDAFGAAELPERRSGTVDSPGGPSGQATASGGSQ